MTKEYCDTPTKKAQIQREGKRFLRKKNRRSKETPSQETEEAIDGKRTVLFAHILSHMFLKMTPVYCLGSEQEEGIDIDVHL